MELKFFFNFLPFVQSFHRSNPNHETLQQSDGGLSRLLQRLLYIRSLEVAWHGNRTNRKSRKPSYVDVAAVVVVQNSTNGRVVINSHVFFATAFF